MKRRAGVFIDNNGSMEEFKEKLNKFFRKIKRGFLRKKIVQIAIDGPVASGKGSLGRALAKKLNALYVYTGGMYRALAFACLKGKIDLYNESRVAKFLTKISIEIKPPNLVFLNEKDISTQIHDQKVDLAVPVISSLPKVRELMVEQQKKIVGGKNAVVEGRDIATHVLPNADLKIYLTASLKERTKRRFRQLGKRRDHRTFEDVLREIKDRDRQDIERDTSPLIIPPDAYILDTTNLTIEETVERVMKKLREKGLA